MLIKMLVNLIEDNFIPRTNRGKYYFEIPSAILERCSTSELELYEILKDIDQEGHENTYIKYYLKFDDRFYLTIRIDHRHYDFDIYESYLPTDNSITLYECYNLLDNLLINTIKCKNNIKSIEEIKNNNSEYVLNNNNYRHIYNNHQSNLYNILNKLDLNPYFFMDLLKDNDNNTINISFAVIVSEEKNDILAFKIILDSYGRYSILNNFNYSSYKYMVPIIDEQVTLILNNILISLI